MKCFIGLEQMINIEEFETLLSFAKWMELYCEGFCYKGRVPHDILTYGRVMMVVATNNDMQLIAYKNSELLVRLVDVGMLEIYGENFYAKILI